LAEYHIKKQKQPFKEIFSDNTSEKYALNYLPTNNNTDPNISEVIIRVSETGHLTGDGHQAPDGVK